MNFKQSESIGKIAEKYITDLFNGCGLKTTPVSFEERKLWDVRVDIPRSWGLRKEFFTVEVKHDVYQKKSGNLAVEIWNSRQNAPSGIKITQADLWSFVLSDSIWICRTADLRNYVNYVPAKRKAENVGDGNATVLLYPSEEILSTIFHRVDKITKRQVIEIVKELCSKNY